MQKILAFMLTAVMLVGCSSSPRQKYRIGVSQCSEDIWREKQNEELRTEAYFHEGVELCFAAAYDSDERQVLQIDSLVDEGIDLLIVAPNQMATISPAIDRAYDRGIPVIVFERKTDSKKYTAHMGADNYEMGRLMGEYIATRLNGRGRVMEVMGLRGSSPAIERHNGFTDAVARYPGISLVATLQGDWTEQSGYDATRQWLAQQSASGKQSAIDFVFGQNDRMAIGARKALTAVHHPSPSTHFCGIDGLPGEQGGIRLVREGLLDATYIYPTHGDQLLRLAIDILEGRHYRKENPLMSALVTRDNANVLLMQSEETLRQSAYLDQLHAKADDYLQQLSTQRMATVLLIGFVVLLMLMAVVTYRYYLQKARIGKEREQMTRDRLDFYTQAAHQLRTPLTLIEGPLAQLAETPELQQASRETTTLFSIVRRNTRQLTELIAKMLERSVEGGALSVEGGAWSVEGEVRSEESVDSPAQVSDTQGETLLVVDDNADIRTYLRSILHGKYKVLEAADGKQGLEMARAEVPDLIVSDVMMPVMDGLAFCQRVKADFVTSHIPVILLTARALSSHQVEGYESGADAYITKPFVPEVLLARIDNLLKNRQMLKNLFRVEGGVASVEGGGLSVEGGESIPLTSHLSPTSGLQNDPFLLKFRHFIEENLANSDLNVETVGVELGLSRVQLYRKVKALTGTSPVELLRTARLLRGKELLDTTTLSVSEVAYRVGFTSPSYFAKCFRDEFGMSPSDLRQ